jgi:hypothetical protein
MLTAFLSHVNVGDLDGGHDHRESSIPCPLREVATIVHPAIVAIEVLCRDALPMSGNEDLEYHTAVWKHFE